MGIKTNTASWGDMGQHLFQMLRSPDVSSLTAVSGYVGRETINRLIALVREKPELSIKLVVGMAAKEGLAERTYDALGQLHSLLAENSIKSKDSQSGVYWFFSGPDGERLRGMHAKGYRVLGNKIDELFVGSSNFSASGLGLSGNVELNVTDTSETTKRDFDTFFSSYLQSGFNFVPYDKVENFPIKGQVRKEKLSRDGLERIEKPENFRSASFVDIDLAENIENKERSSLNVCFGKGRLARATGKVSPRQWYEVEIICTKEATENPAYPKGDFQAKTSDGFVFSARTQGANHKNLRSKGSLNTLGLWIKPLLEEAGALSSEPQELVTRETFETYGNSILRIYRTSEHEAVLHFPQDPSSL